MIDPNATTTPAARWRVTGHGHVFDCWHEARSYAHYCGGTTQVEQHQEEPNEEKI